MKVWEQLTYWTNDGLIGQTAGEVLKLARAHGEPAAPTGMPQEQPIPFAFPMMSEEDPEIEQFLRRVGILYQAVDRHLFWHKRVMIVNKPFSVIPDWAEEDLVSGMEIDPNWVVFQEAALKVVDAFVDTLGYRGILRTGEEDASRV